MLPRAATPTALSSGFRIVARAHDKPGCSTMPGSVGCTNPHSGPAFSRPSGYGPGSRGQCVKTETTIRTNASATMRCAWS